MSIGTPGRVPGRVLRRTARSVLVTMLAGSSVLLVSTAAVAHEDRKQGHLELAVGFGNEPAYVGQPNSVQLILVHDGEPVIDLGDTLDLEVSFGEEEPLQLSLEPFFEPGEFGTPGDYRAWFIPTSAGSYTFHFIGAIDGEDLDQTFTSGPSTFSDVETGTDIEYPVKDPTTTELAERIDREIPRLNEAIDEVRVSAATTATDEASSARTIGFVGIAFGLLGVAVGGTAVVVGRKRT